MDQDTYIDKDKAQKIKHKQGSKENPNKASKNEALPLSKDAIFDGISGGDLINCMAKGIFAKSHQGPLPPPEDFREYDKILPGAADRIMKMAEEVTYCHTKCQVKQVDSDGRNSLLGLVFAFIIALVVLAMAFYLILKGANSYGFATVISGLSALVIVFFNKSRKTKHDDFTSEEVSASKEKKR